MFIQVEHETGQSCFNAVALSLCDMEVGESIDIHGMAMGKRTIHIDVVKALVHAVSSEIGIKMRCVDVDGEGGWSRYLTVVCTGEFK